jgi:hypothetical protein
MNKDISTRFRLQARRYYSPEHLKAAALFTRQCCHIEDDYLKTGGGASDALISDHRSYVTGAIFAVMSFLEATINELFADTVEYPDGAVTGKIDSTTKLLLADMWKLNIPRTASYDVITKFQIALTLARKDTLDPGTTPCQDMQILKTIRNTLIHYEPIWDRGKETQADKKILNLQQEKKFSFNPLMTQRSSTFFPDLCLSHGCAEWAVKKSIEFVTLFSSRMGATLLFDENSPSLKTRP